MSPRAGRRTAQIDRISSRNVLARGGDVVRCRVVGGADDGKRISVGRDVVRVGSDPACHLPLRDDSVSWHHAELRLVPQGVEVKDLGSTNGTRYGDTRVSLAVVPTDATLHVGAAQLRLESKQPLAVPPSKRTRFGALVGITEPMREFFAILELVAATDATVLLEGESGTGKELAARAIHDASDRAAAPFVVLDCGAIGGQLLESHLFGHLKGSFTGAERERAGAFRSADGGSLLLDEIGELPPEAQVKLLRALEAGTVQPLGSDDTIAVDTRVIAATHRHLDDLVARGVFRADLYHRLAVVHVAIPPLRNRLDDLPALVSILYEGRGLDPGPIEGDNLARLRGHGWPGNVRELRNVLERALVLSAGRTRFAELSLSLGSEANGAEAPLEPDGSAPYKDAKEEILTRFERRYVEKVLADAGGHIGHAAERAGLSRKHFRALMDKYGIEPGDAE